MSGVHFYLIHAANALVYVVVPLFLALAHGRPILRETVPRFRVIGCT